jgi:hypothetical protein
MPCILLKAKMCLPFPALTAPLFFVDAPAVSPCVFDAWVAVFGEVMSVFLLDGDLHWRVHA